jgi:hypothetical protein
MTIKDLIAKVGGQPEQAAPPPEKHNNHSALKSVLKAIALTGTGAAIGGGIGAAKGIGKIEEMAKELQHAGMLTKMKLQMDPSAAEAEMMSGMLHRTGMGAGIGAATGLGTSLATDALSTKEGEYFEGFMFKCAQYGIPQDQAIKIAGSFFSGLGQMAARPVGAIAKLFGERGREYGSKLTNMNALRDEMGGHLGVNRFAKEHFGNGIPGEGDMAVGDKIRFLKNDANTVMAERGGAMKDVSWDQVPEAVRSKMIRENLQDVTHELPQHGRDIENNLLRLENDPTYNTLGKATAGGAGGLGLAAYLMSGKKKETPESRYRSMYGNGF